MNFIIYLEPFVYELTIYIPENGSFEDAENAFAKVRIEPLFILEETGQSSASSRLIFDLEWVFNEDAENAFAKVRIEPSFHLGRDRSLHFCDIKAHI
ncbi:hypothetical protein CEXT_677671 [Caerostris extrusa]|uniref:Uncharacterized protein n=1 Tax=Caerostris extrusa TaxID=172846 RepID=A0AAV4N498_CAEEX|nr:hypothetical protein CEXT_677671 [Caerostris extrusa]